MNTEARQLTGAEKEQIRANTLNHMGDGIYVVQCYTRPIQSWRLPKAGEIVIINGKALQVRKEDRFSYTVKDFSGRFKDLYLHEV